MQQDNLHLHDDPGDRLDGRGARSLLRRLREKVADIDPSRIRPRAERAPAPLSFGQERLWLLDRLDLAGGIFNVRAGYRLARVDLASLGRALNEVVRRHELLRTTFAEIDDAPVQLVAPAAGDVLTVEDLSALSPIDGHASVARSVAREETYRYDLRTGPLFRARLFRLSNEDVLLLSMHHIVSDQWSMGILFREIAVLYEAYRCGRESPLAPLLVQYADYALWQRDRSHAGLVDAHMAYWRVQMAGAPALLDLPLSRPRSVEETSSGRSERLFLSRALRQQMELVCRREGITLYMFLLTAFQVLLSKYAGSCDVVVGSPVAGRTRPEVEGLIGFFVNTLPLRVDLSGRPTVREALRRVRNTTLDAFDHQDVPFQRLVAELRPERTLSHSPLFQAVFSMGDALQHGGERTLPLAARRLPMVVNTAPSELALMISADALRGALIYRTGLFDRATIVGMIDHLQQLLAQMVAAPGQEVRRLKLLTQAERAQVLDTWNPRAPDDPGSAMTVDGLVAAQAERTPDAVAVTSTDATLTYEGLTAAAGRLAAQLAECGLEPEARVAVCLPRRPELIVTLLAVLQAGGAYVPLDPSYPAERLAFMLTDADVRVVVTSRALCAAVPVPAGLRVVLVDDPGPGARIRAAHPRRRGCPSALAYVIYTSGSTGQPKGVAVDHHGVVNLLASQTSRLGIEASSRVLQFASVSFDAAVPEIFETLAAGGTMVLAASDALLPGAPLIETLREQQVSIVTLPPSVLAIIAPEDCAGVQTVVSAGEALTPAQALRWSAGRTLINAYGPTETTVCACLEQCDAASATAPIGRPLTHVRLYVLDGQEEPVPVGVAGELYIGGAQLARGYVGRARMTATRFVPDPFGPTPGGRMYRSGDRVRWRTDGELEYLGRMDRQVKIRGFRIEPGDVETALTACPGVVAAHVGVWETPGREKQLIAYVVGQARDAARAHLQARLPDYLVPTMWVTLDRLPLTANGKVDTAALPPPAPATRTVSRPRSELEERVAEAWREALAIADIDVHDNFFDLGGTSLLLHHLHSRLKTIRSDLRMVDFFRYPTVATLAEYLGALTPDQTFADTSARAEGRRAARRRAR